MPVFQLECTGCGKVTRILAGAGTSDWGHCPDCGVARRRRPSPPSTSVVERLDNGAMPKTVERFADAERLFKERSGK